MTGRSGLRASSRLTLTLSVAHDGDRDALAGHLAAEAEAQLRHWGVEVLDTATTSYPLTVGDWLSPLLPTITPLAAADGSSTP